VPIVPDLSLWLVHSTLRTPPNYSSAKTPPSGPTGLSILRAFSCAFGSARRFYHFRVVHPRKNIRHAVWPQSRANSPPRRGRQEGKSKTTQRRREEHEKDSVVACRGMGILPMIPRGGTLAPRGGRLFLPRRVQPELVGRRLRLYFMTTAAPGTLSTSLVIDGMLLFVAQANRIKRRRVGRIAGDSRRTRNRRTILRNSSLALFLKRLRLVAARRKTK